MKSYLVFYQAIRIYALYVKKATFWFGSAFLAKKAEFWSVSAMSKVGRSLMERGKSDRGLLGNVRK